MTLTDWSREAIARREVEGIVRRRRYRHFTRAFRFSPCGEQRQGYVAAARAMVRRQVAINQQDVPTPYPDEVFYAIPDDLSRRIGQLANKLSEIDGRTVTPLQAIDRAVTVTARVGMLSTLKLTDLTRKLDG